MNRLAEGITDLIDTHKDNEIAAIEEIWENWKGEDATIAHEEFGIRIRSAPSMLRQIIADMARAVSEDGVEQACAMASLNNLIAKAHEGIIEATGYQPSNTETATKKFVGTVTVNRVPFLGDLIAAVDYIITLTSQGKVDDGASRYINAFMDKVWPSYGTALTSQLCNEVRDDLVNGADEILNELYDYRGKIAGDYLAQSAEDFGAMPIKDLVPGYRSGT